jgi:hypothetical protein
MFGCCIFLDFCAAWHLGVGITNWGGVLKQSLFHRKRQVAEWMSRSPLATLGETGGQNEL